MNTFVDLPLPVALEVVTSKIAFFELGVGGNLAGQSSFVQGYPDDNANIMLCAGWERRSSGVCSKIL